MAKNKYTFQRLTSLNQIKITPKVIVYSKITSGDFPVMTYTCNLIIKSYSLRNNNKISYYILLSTINEFLSDYNLSDYDSTF